MNIADKDRIVVTGMGVVSPLGCGVETVWSRLLAGRLANCALNNNNEKYDMSHLLIRATVFSCLSLPPMAGLQAADFIDDSSLKTLSRDLAPAARPS